MVNRPDHRRGRSPTNSLPSRFHPVRFVRCGSGYRPEPIDSLLALSRPLQPRVPERPPSPSRPRAVHLSEARKHLGVDRASREIESVVAYNSENR